MRTLFWGTPYFATPALRALIGEGFEVCGVVTQPDRPVGRKREIIHSPVKEIGLEESLPVYQPASMKDAEFREALEIMKPDISVVVAYGHILPKDLIDLPRYGTLNIHASLLPLLRGAAPIQAAIRQGMDETGVTIMKMVPELDAGPVILQSSTPIHPDETYGELQTRLSEIGAIALIEALALISVGKAQEIPQDDSRATYASKVNRDTARIDWSLSVKDVVNTVRGYDPKPSAHTSLDGIDVKMFGASYSLASLDEFGPNIQPGTVVKAQDNLLIACGNGVVEIAEVQPAGKKRMPASAWISGRGVRLADRFK